MPSFIGLQTNKS